MHTISGMFYIANAITKFKTKSKQNTLDSLEGE
jgi:hypothetical protein